MFEKFTDTARAVVVLAKDCAEDLGQQEIGTGHMLLAIAASASADESPKAAAVIAALGVTPEAIRDQTVSVLTRRNDTSPGHLPFTQDLKKSLEFALRSALMLGDNHIGPHHLLAGLVRQADSTAGKILARLGITEDTIHAAIRDSTPAPSPTAARTPVVYLAIGKSIFKNGGKVYPDHESAAAAHPDSEIAAFPLALTDGEFFDVGAALPQNRFKSWGSYADYPAAFAAAKGFQQTAPGYNIVIRIMVPDVTELRGKDSRGHDVLLGRRVEYSRVPVISRLTATGQ
ncbi:MAG TPA: Clp protease N-terminal domain-containing protein [Arthrobacter sp.]